MATEAETPKSNSFNEELWRTIFAEGHPVLLGKQREFRAYGQAPRCKLCLAPFGGILESADTPGPSNRNPRYCSMCDAFIRQNPGGAKVRMSMVFADVRGSTRYAEELALEEYVRLINSFYAVTTGAFVESDGFMMDVIGDEVFALYPTGFSGVSDEPLSFEERERLAARKAFAAAERLAKCGRVAVPDGLPFGISVHTAEVYIGTMRGAEEGIFDVRVWGAEVNKAARLCSAAQAGEALVSDASAALLELDPQRHPYREVTLKGISRPVGAYVLSARE
jgi:adenylate cyclase